MIKKLPSSMHSIPTCGQTLIPKIGAPTKSFGHYLVCPAKCQKEEESKKLIYIYKYKYKFKVV